MKLIKFSLQKSKCTYKPTHELGIQSTTVKNKVVCDVQVTASWLLPFLYPKSTRISFLCWRMPPFYILATQLMTKIFLEDSYFPLRALNYTECSRNVSDRLYSSAVSFCT